MTRAVTSGDKVKSVSKCLESVDSCEGRERLAKLLESLPYPHYAPAPEGLLVRIEASGKRTTGRFVNRKFQPIRATRK